MQNNTIFISIASYRDSEVVPSILDCVNKSKYPENLYLGICWQHDETENLDTIKSIDNIKIYDCDWRDSKGACWSRHLIQKNLFDDQKYYLQLDSHHRFLKNWDEELINLLNIAKTKSSKPIVGTYGTTYWKNNCEFDPTPYKINTFDIFTDDGDLISKPLPIKNYQTLNTKLIPARLLSGHFIFSDSHFITQCPYDPNYYFRGEELVLSARAYTHGYDMYHPTKTIIWHEYLRPNQHKHWSDHIKSNGFIIEGEDRNIKSKIRQRKLFGMEKNDIDFREYGLGNQRSLHDYEKYCGIDFKHRRAHKYAVDIRDDAPYPFLMNEDEWKSGLLNKFELDITWNLSDIPKHDDYDFWFFGFENNQGQLLARSDFKPDSIIHKKILNKEINTYKAIFGSETKPNRCIIMPHSKSKGWIKKIVIPC